MEKGEVFAITAAPGRPVEGLQSPWIGDEAAIAAATAEHARIRHLVCRSEYQELSHLLDEVAAADFQPFNNPANLPWIRQLCLTANAEGAGVITGAFAGNLTISLGGPAFLADFWHENGLAAWIEVARGLALRDELSWLQIAARSFGWMVPRAGYSLFRRIFGRPATFNPSLPLLRQPYREMAEKYRRERFGDARAWQSNRDHVAGLIRNIEPGNKYALACWGVDLRDPTADRRLAELCLSLPVNAYVDGKHGRPAFHQAFKDRLSDEVLEGRHVGAQAADWFATIRPNDVLDGFRRYASNPLVGEMFDLAAVETMIEGWPTSSAAADLVHDEYCNQLLGGLAVASFINAHFPGRGSRLPVLPAA
jgi:asparagine synthase (glutamine-hydrolysing)